MTAYAETSREKVWGSELWIVNNDKYCCKYLYLNKGAVSSYHRHLQKTETFLCTKGNVSLTIEGKKYNLDPLAEPITIEPNEYHKFEGLENSVILEVSTHHDDSDVERLEESKP